ncbi:hypothetical protein V5799_020698 [Amblyomma americanum]
MGAICTNDKEITDRLRFLQNGKHEVAKRQCSGFSGMLTFLIKGGLKESTIFLKNLKLITLGESLGSIHSLVELP